ncbi:hypothetical protein Y032_0354g3311 [Ancylostoma ceylanicum]|uniref:Enoyl-CoA hydratase/isomerase family protein n=1 Tax=Ancylostoma ceylanicum TaxID=53326 RepID=A0A016RXF7_9BILA|nr:hypothetical protein Y032_0354g3311 [Ancylostoma ceylanicum]
MSNHLVTEKKGNVFWIRFNRPEKYNAISSEMYRGLIAAFDEADSDEDVLITVLTGTGKYYSAGSDFSFAEMEHMRSSDGDALYKIWVDKIIRHTKLVVALVNGPALGVACTTLALCDVVLASDQAYFHCPFTELGLNPEGASSYTFVNIMGYQKAVRLALLAEKMSANELHDAGLVTKVIPHASFQAETEKFISNYSKLAHQSVIVSKRLLRPQNVVDNLLTINRTEYEVLMKQFSSEETMERMMSKFFSKI